MAAIASETIMSDSGKPVVNGAVIDKVQPIAPNHARRSSYGPNSPVVGERGERTRQAITQAAFEAFEGKGLHGTSIDEIAEGAGVSRATLYQYFESKEQIFLELIRGAAADLLRVIRRLGPVGPTPEGFDNLHWWLGEWAWVQDKYKALYLQWAVLDSPQPSMRPMVTEQIVSYVSTLSPRLAAAVDKGVIDIDGLATVLPALLFRVNDYRQKGNIRGLSDEDLLDSLATFVQLTLFPSTPASAFADHGEAEAPAHTTVPSQNRRSDVSRLRQPDVASFAGGTEQTPETVQRILSAGAATFADRGFHGASVGDVLRAARAGRGTFYRHFDDKTDLLVTLARDCMGRLEDLAGRFASVVAAEDEESALRQWVERCLALHRQYRGVFRAMLQEESHNVALKQLRVHSGETILHAFDDALATIDREYPFDVRVGSLILLALLERGPDYAFGTPYDLSDERIVGILTALIERGLLDRKTGPKADRRATRKPAPQSR